MELPEAAQRMVQDLGKSLVTEATTRACLEYLQAANAAALPPPPALFRHRRGRGISRAAKRRHGRARRHWQARPFLHLQAGRAWEAVAAAAQVLL